MLLGIAPETIMNKIAHTCTHVHTHKHSRTHIHTHTHAQTHVHCAGLPGPSNTPTHEDEEGDGELLYAPRREDLWMLTDQPGIDLLLAGPGALEHLQQVCVRMCVCACVCVRMHVCVGLARTVIYNLHLVISLPE